jgi:colanic acid/amylovoran biosynthesis glycosyltransferase
LISDTARKPRIVYLLSRFPRTSETFIVRELAALERRGRFQLELRSLFPSPDLVVHEVAEPWVPKAVRPAAAATLRGVFWAIGRHPLVTARTVRTVFRGHRGLRRKLQALATSSVACAHSRDLAHPVHDGQPRPHIHAHYATWPALAAWVCQQFTGTSYSFTAHAHDIYVDQSMLDRKIGDAASVITISQYNRRLLREIPGAERTPVHVVHCGVDIADYPFRLRTIPTAGPLRALCVASLQEYKGHSVLIQALADGGPGVDRIQLHLIGDGALRASLERQAQSLGIAERITFHGSRTEADVRQALARADLFVLPSVVARDGQMEGLPIALIEALASGVPVVTTALSGIPEIVPDGRAGLLAEPGSADALRQAMEQTVADGEATQRRSRAGRELVEREFQLDTGVARLEQILGEQLTASA